MKVLCISLQASVFRKKADQEFSQAFPERPVDPSAIKRLSSEELSKWVMMSIKLMKDGKITAKEKLIRDAIADFAVGFLKEDSKQIALGFKKIEKLPNPNDRVVALCAVLLWQYSWQNWRLH